MEGREASDGVKVELPDNVVDLPGDCYNVVVGNKCLLVEKNIPPDLLKIVLELLYNSNQALRNGNIEEYKTDLDFAINFLDSVLTLPSDHPSLKRTVEMPSFPAEGVVPPYAEGHTEGEFGRFVLAARRFANEGRIDEARELLDIARKVRDGVLRTEKEE